MATQPFRDGGDFTGDVTFDSPVKYVRQASYVGNGFTSPYISAISDGFAFGVTNAGGTTRAFAIRGNDLGPGATTTLFIKSGGDIITTSFLTSLPNYNASVAQTLGHDASGNLIWINTP